MARKQHFTAADMWFVGEDKQLQFTILDENEAAVNITGWAIEFSLAEKVGDVPLITKTVGAGIVLTTAASGLLTITVADADTDDLAPGVYVYGLKRTDNNTETVLAFGDVVLQQAAAA